jgi:hypothetical protein
MSYTAPPVIRHEFPDLFEGAFVELRNPILVSWGEVRRIRSPFPRRHRRKSEAGTSWASSSGNGTSDPSTTRRASCSPHISPPAPPIRRERRPD